jgi:hypothetical protein
MQIEAQKNPNLIDPGVHLERFRLFLSMSMRHRTPRKFGIQSLNRFAYKTYPQYAETGWLLKVIDGGGEFHFTFCLRILNNSSCWNNNVSVCFVSNTLQI